MITDYVFSGNWLSMHSEDIVGPEIAKKNKLEGSPKEIKLFCTVKHTVLKLVNIIFHMIINTIESEKTFK